MSGPKGYEVHLTAAELRAREIQATQRRCQRLADRLFELEAQLAALTGSGPPRSIRVPRGALERLRERERQLVADLERVSGDIDAARRKSVTTALEAAWAGFSGPAFTGTEWTVPGAAPTKKDNEGGADRAAIRGSLTRCVALLADLEEADRAALLRRASEIDATLTSSQLGTARAALLILQTDVDRALTKQRERTRAQRAVAAIMADFAAIDATDAPTAGPDLDGEFAALRTLARQATTDSDVVTLRGRATAYRARLDRAERAAYILDQTKAALAKLGYDTGAELIVDAGEAFVATRPDVADHGLRVQVLPDGRVLTRVVAFAETDPVRDEEVERLTCGDLDTMQQLWQRAGLAATRTHHQPIGSVPVTLTVRPARRGRRQSRPARQAGMP